MGGRGAMSGVIRFGPKFGPRLDAKQYKNAVSDEARFIFQELKQQPALQHIIRRSFKGNTAVITFELGGGEFKVTKSFTEQLNLAQDKLTQRLKEEQKKKHTVSSWSAYDVARAKAQAIKQALDELEKLKKK